MTRINLEQTYYITQIVAVFAVVISLFYVGLQVKQNTETLRINAQRDLSTEYIRLQHVLAQNADLMEIFIRSETKPESLNNVERRRVWAILDTLIELAASEYYRFQKGVLPAYSWEPLARDLRIIMQLPIYQEVWSVRKHSYSDDFQEFINQLIKEGATS